MRARRLFFRSGDNHIDSAAARTRNFRERQVAARSSCLLYSYILFLGSLHQFDSITLMLNPSFEEDFDNQGYILSLNNRDIFYVMQSSQEGCLKIKHPFRLNYSVPRIASSVSFDPTFTQPGQSFVRGGFRHARIGFVLEAADIFYSNPRPKEETRCPRAQSTFLRSLVISYAVAQSPRSNFQGRSGRWHFSRQKIIFFLFLPSPAPLSSYRPLSPPTDLPPPLAPSSIIFPVRPSAIMSRL